MASAKRPVMAAVSAAEWDYLARQRCQCWSHHKPLMMHRVYEAASGGCVSRKEGTIGLLNGVSAARRVSHLTSRKPDQPTYPWSRS